MYGDNTGKIRIFSQGQNSVCIKGLNKDESEILAGSIRGGHSWIKCGPDGRLQHVKCYEELPGPTTDEEMLPFWRKATSAETSQQELFGFDETTKSSLKNSSPSIYIAHLCGYNYTPENYRRQSEILTGWGFICMRSPRDQEGRYWETWYLPGIWAAKGSLKKAVQDDKKKSKNELEAALQFILYSGAQFGTLDVVVQRMAAIMGD